MSRWGVPVVCVVVLACSVGCSTYPVHPVPPIAADAAAAHASWGTTQVGAQPYVNPEQTKALFNRDLLSHGVLPVLLVVDNSGSSSEIERVRSGIALSKP